MLITERYHQRQQVNDTATMKVKMFSGNDMHRAENELNQWLAENNIEVHHIGQSQCERNGNLLIVISVFYHSYALTN